MKNNKKKMMITLHYPGFVTGKINILAALPTTL
jgi:hypothetical protein